MTNRRIEAAEAVEIGIAKRMVPSNLLDETLRLDLVAGPVTSLDLTKMLLNNAYRPIEHIFAAIAFMQSVAFGSREFSKGVDAFHQK